MFRKRGALALLAAALLAAAPAAAEPMLRPAVTVNSDVIRLGDLFSDAGAHAADVIAPAPPPGSRTLFDATWLAAAAQEHELDWRPASPFDRAAVERATRVIGGDAVAAAVRAAVAQRQSIDGTEIRLDNPALRLLVPASAQGSLDIENLTIDPRTGHFSAVVSVAGASLAPQPVAGQLIRMVKVAVLDRVIAPGEIIGAGDIAHVTQRADRLAADTILDANGLIGKTPRHVLRAEEPLRSDDVATPLVVHKGDLVTLVLETPSMRLTAQGKALDDGEMHAVIRVANTKSNRVVDATVIAANLAAVTPPSQLAERAEALK